MNGTTTNLAPNRGKGRPFGSKLDDQKLKESYMKKYEISFEQGEICLNNYRNGDVNGKHYPATYYARKFKKVNDRVAIKIAEYEKEREN